jgi:hypothetical protein
MQIPTYNAKALKELGETIYLPDLGVEDWDLICADASRVCEFCDAYECEELSAEAKVALMQLIAASYSEHLKEQGSATEVEQRVTDLLEADFDIHQDTILYWSGKDSDGLGHPFAISPLMRGILQRRNHAA